MPTDTTDPAPNEAILDPRGDINAGDEQLAARLDTLDGAIVGFLDNSKTNADVLLNEVDKVLRTEYSIKETVHVRKSKSPIPADSLTNTLASRCDAVVNAYGDCGSCTSWCIYDSIDLEHRGVPVATVNSDEFVKLGQSEARSLGMPGLPIVTVPHPMGDVPEDTVRERARAIRDELTSVLTENRRDVDAAYRNRYLTDGESLSENDLVCPL